MRDERHVFQSRQNRQDDLPIQGWHVPDGKQAQANLPVTKHSQMV